ncbi:MAG: hypothetical protein LBG97_07490 [Coriobacteriales bacterium]|jgi:hypothetical protein|nr:hypothetical protein [Coriobacteriales bacterium]
MPKSTDFSNEETLETNKDKDIKANKAVEKDFERLSAMVDALPKMSALNERLLQAHVARQLLSQFNKALVLSNEHENYTAIINAATRAAHSAEQNGDSENRAKQLGIVRLYSDIDATRIGPLNRAIAEFFTTAKDSMLASYLTSLLDDTRVLPSKELVKSCLSDFLLDDDEYNKLLLEVDSFQEEYQRLYALCSKSLSFTTESD